MLVVSRVDEVGKVAQCLGGCNVYCRLLEASFKLHYSKFYIIGANKFQNTTFNPISYKI